MKLNALRFTYNCFLPEINLVFGRINSKVLGDNSDMRTVDLQTRI